MDSQHGVLCKKYPDMVEESEKKLRDLKKNWERLEDLANARWVLFLSTDYFYSACYVVLCTTQSTFTATVIHH